MYVIVEKTDVGGRDTIYKYLLSTESVYGLDTFLPAFNDKEKAQKYLDNRDDKYRYFEIVELRMCGEICTTS